MDRIRWQSQNKYSQVFKWEAPLAPNPSVKISVSGIEDKAQYADDPPGSDSITFPVLKVEFFKKGTTAAISEVHVGTDGDSATTQGGEEKQFDVKITPDNITLNFSLSNTEVSISPMSGSGTTTVTVTGKGDGKTDSVFLVQTTETPSEVIARLPIKIHKPKKLILYEVSNPRLPDGSMPDGNKYGDYEVRRYKIYDIRNREIDILGYFISEDNTMVENDDGKGGEYSIITPHKEGLSACSYLEDIVKFTWESGELEPGHKYKWNQKMQILGLNVENGLWKHDARRIKPQKLEIYSFKGQW